MKEQANSSQLTYEYIMLHSHVDQIKVGSLWKPRSSIACPFGVAGQSFQPETMLLVVSVVRLSDKLNGNGEPQPMVQVRFLVEEKVSTAQTVNARMWHKVFRRIDSYDQAE